MSESEIGKWASPILSIWAADAALQAEFESVCDFFEWARAVAQKLIESAFTKLKE